MSQSLAQRRWHKRSLGQAGPGTSGAHGSPLYGLCGLQCKTSGVHGSVYHSGRAQLKSPSCCDSHCWSVPYKAAAHLSQQAQDFSHSPIFQPVRRLSESGSGTAQFLPSPGVAWHPNFSGVCIHSPRGCVPPPVCLLLCLYSPQ